MRPTPLSLLLGCLLLLATGLGHAAEDEKKDEPAEWELDSDATPEPSPSPTPAATPTAVPSPVSTPAPALSTGDVIAMSKAKIPDSIIIKKIVHSGVVFDLEVDDLVALKKAGVSGKVIEALVATADAPAPAQTPTPDPDAESTPEPRPSATPEDEDIDLHDGPFIPAQPSSPSLPAPSATPVLPPWGSTTPSSSSSSSTSTTPAAWRGSLPATRSILTYGDGIRDGAAEADVIATRDWSTAGFAGGFCLGTLGCLGATGGAYFLDMPQRRPEKMETSSPTEYQEGYFNGYKTRLKTKRAQSAFLGGTVGGLACIGLYLVIVIGSAASASNESSSDAALSSLRF